MLSNTELDLIRHSFLFFGVQGDVLRFALCDPRLKFQSYRKGDLIFGGKQFERAFCILLSGRISVKKDTDDGRGLNISTLLPGSCFGAAALFNDCSEYATILTAAAACRIIFLPEPLLLHLMRLDIKIAENYIRYQSNRILFLNDKIAGLSAGSAEKRLAHWLLENAAETENGLICPLSHISMSSLASTLNIGRASLYRALDALEKTGAVINQHKDILIQNPAQLRQL